MINTLSEQLSVKCIAVVSFCRSCSECEFRVWADHSVPERASFVGGAGDGQTCMVPILHSL